jgi:dGTPase
MREFFQMLSVPEKFVSRSVIPDPIVLGNDRTEFNRDRDRILYSKAFRRLSGKTQVFVPISDDHIRTRLTHTLQVAQLSRTISTALGLNSDLAEVIALGHDLGHTPFGHVGEDVLNQIMNNCHLPDIETQKITVPVNHRYDDQRKVFGFKHNLQSLRVVIDLEMIYDHFGLNLTNFSLFGISNHTKVVWAKKCSYFQDGSCYLNKQKRDCQNNGDRSLDFYDQYEKYTFITGTSLPAWSFESLIVSYADEIAQRQHDVEDALHMNIISKKELLKIINERFNKYITKRNSDENQYQYLLSKIRKEDNPASSSSFVSKLLISIYVNDLLESTRQKLNEFNKNNYVSKKEEFSDLYPSLHLDDVINLVGFSKELQEIDEGQDDVDKIKDGFHDFIRNAILNSHKVQVMDGKGRYIIRKIFEAYITNPKQCFDTTLFMVIRKFIKNNKLLNNLDNDTRGYIRSVIENPSLKSNPRFMNILLRTICDNISGMTDSYAIDQYHKLYG